MILRAGARHRRGRGRLGQHWGHARIFDREEMALPKVSFCAGLRAAGRSFGSCRSRMHGHVGQCPTHLFDGDIRGFFEQRQDQRLAGIDAPRAPITAQWFRTCITLGVFQGAPPAEAGWADAKTLSCRAVAQARGTGRHNTSAKIKVIETSTCLPPSTSGRQFEPVKPRFENPARFTQIGA
jgi:hypothetical protein